MPSSLIFSMILLVSLFFLLEARSLVKRREFKELIVACLLLLLALTYGMDYMLNWNFLPNPNILLTLLKPVSESMDKLLQVKG